MKNKREPIQYNFSANWENEILPLRRNLLVEMHFQKIRIELEDLFESMHEEQRQFNPDLVKRICEEHQQNARAKNHDLGWLKKTFAGADLAGLMLSIAQALYPKMEWVILEDRIEHAIVTDTKRTIVFDMIYFDVLSGAASLLIVDDKKFKPSKEAKIEAIRFIELRTQEELKRLKGLGETLNPTKE